jgi:hypothetical protein
MGIIVNLQYGSMTFLLPLLLDFLLVFLIGADSS